MRHRLATGSVTVTTVPTGWLAAARMMPPCSATILCEIAKPEAGAARLGGEERLEHLRRGRRGSIAGTLIGDLDAQELTRSVALAQDVEVGLHAGADR